MTPSWHFIADDLGEPVGPEPRFTCSDEWRRRRDSGIDWIESWDCTDVEALLAKHAAFHDWMRLHGVDRA